MLRPDQTRPDRRLSAAVLKRSVCAGNGHRAGSSTTVGGGGGYGRLYSIVYVCMHVFLCPYTHITPAAGVSVSTSLCVSEGEDAARAPTQLFTCQGGGSILAGNTCSIQNMYYVGTGYYNTYECTLLYGVHIYYLTRITIIYVLRTDIRKIKYMYTTYIYQYDKIHVIYLFVYLNMDTYEKN